VPLYNYPDHPVLTLQGLAGTSTGVDKYGINDATGLGPNGSDIYITYRVTISSITAVTVGDSSLPNSLGLLSGGQYTPEDVKVGDWITDPAGFRVFRIKEILNKGVSSIDLIYEDVWMAIGKSRSDRNNFLTGGDNAIIFSVSENNDPLISWNGAQYFTDTQAIDRLVSYFDVFEPSRLFTFYPSGTGGIEIGDLVTATGGTGAYSLVKVSSEDQTIVGTVAQMFGDKNVVVRPTNTIETNFDDPPMLVGGQIGSLWYSTGTGGLSLTGSNSREYFYQLTNAIETSIQGTVESPTFDQTQYDLILNGTTVIPVSATGPTAMSMSDIITNINAYSNVTYVTGVTGVSGGGAAQATTNQALSYSPDLAALLSFSGGTGTYPVSVQFSITDSNSTTFTVSPTTADALLFGLPVASASQLAQDINNAASANSSPISAVAGVNTLTITDSGGSFSVANVNPDVNGSNFFNSGGAGIAGISTGTYSSPPVENYLRLTRADGGSIVVQGSWQTSAQGSGIYSVSNGNPPWLLLVNEEESGSNVAIYGPTGA